MISNPIPQHPSSSSKAKSVFLISSYLLVLDIDIILQRGMVISNCTYSHQGYRRKRLPYIQGFVMLLTGAAGRPVGGAPSINNKCHPRIPRMYVTGTSFVGRTHRLLDGVILFLASPAPACSPPCLAFFFVICSWVGGLRFFIIRIWNCLPSKLDLAKVFLLHDDLGLWEAVKCVMSTPRRTRPLEFLVSTQGKEAEKNLSGPCDRLLAAGGLRRSLLCCSGGGGFHVTARFDHAVPACPGLSAAGLN